MMSSLSPSEEQTGLKAKKNWKSVYDERMASLQNEGLSSSYDHPDITHPDVDFTPCPGNDMSRKALSTSPTRPMSDGITVGVSSTFDRMMITLGNQKGGASSSTRLQPQLTSSSLCLTPASGAAGDISDMFTGVMTGLEELRRDMIERIDRVEERAHQSQEKLRGELTHVKSQARVDQAQLIRNTQANDGDGARSYAGAQQSSRTNYESKHRERPRAAPSRPGWTNQVPPEANATPETRLPAVPQVRSMPVLTTVSQDTTMYTSIFEPLNRSPSPRIQPREERGQEGHLRSRSHTRTSQMAALFL